MQNLEISALALSDRSGAACECPESRPRPESLGAYQTIRVTEIPRLFFGPGTSEDSVATPH